MLAMKDLYRELCGKTGMNFDLMKKYIRFQTIALTPITPHVAEHVWRQILGNQTSVMNCLWPVIHEQNEEELVKISSRKFILDCARDLRLKYKSHMNGLEKKRAKKLEVTDPNHVDVYVSDNLPFWQKILVDTIKSNIVDNKWPDMKVIAAETSPKKRPELTKYKKKMMPFVAFLREQQEKIKPGGTDVLDNVTCSFNQCEL